MANTELTTSASAVTDAEISSVAQRLASAYGALVAARREEFKETPEGGDRQVRAVDDPEWQRRGWEINHPRAQTNSTYRLASFAPRVPRALGTPTNPVGNAVSPAQPLGTQPFANGPRVPPYKETVEQVVGTGGVDEGEPASPHDGAGQGVDGGEIAEPPEPAEPRRKRGGGRPAKERQAGRELVARMLADPPRLDWLPEAADHFRQCEQIDYWRFQEAPREL